MNEERLAEFGIAIVTMLVVILVAVVAIQPAQARDVEPDWTWKVAPSDRTNAGVLIRMKMDEIGEKVQAIIEEHEAEQAALEAEQEAYYETYYAPTYYAPSYYPTDGLTPQSGVNYHDGRTETYYSSNVLYHQDTGFWTLDDEGFYRTDEGYYVVAASDMEQGTVFETSKGTAQVLDCGCADGVTDFYVRW